MFFRRKKGASGGPAAERSAPAQAALAGEQKAAEPVSSQFLTGDQHADRSTVQVLLDTIARVSESQDLDSLLVDIVDRSVELTGAERGLLLMRGPEGTLQVRVARSQVPDPTTGSRTLKGGLRFSTTIAKRVMEDTQAVRATVHSESEALELGRSVYDLKLRAVMCVPLTRARDLAGGETTRTAGVLYVDSRAATRQFSQRDLGLFAALAQHISIALENAVKVQLEKSLELAKAIQSDLMPAIPKDVPGYDLHGWYRPAEQAAGDFFDFVPTRGGKVAVVVGDATGHGIGPALITATAQAGLRSYLRLVSDPGEVVTLLNQDLCERIEDGRFITLFLGILDPSGTVHAVNAGHEPPVVWRKASGELQTLGRGGPALGMVEEEVYRTLEPLSLEPGDVLLAFTDGLTETRDPADPDSLFGIDNLRGVLQRTASEGQSAERIALSVAEAAMRHGKEVQEDDLTLLVVRRQ